MTNPSTFDEYRKAYEEARRDADQYKALSHEANRLFIDAAEQALSYKRDVERYRDAMHEVMRQVDGNIRATVRDCVNGMTNVQDIYEYCDAIEAAIDAAMEQSK